MTQAVCADVIDGEDFVDPTRPLLAGGSRDAGAAGAGQLDVTSFIRNVLPSSYDVSFIRASGTYPMAVVNNERVTIGDSVGGAEVIAISRNSVTLLIDNEERSFSIFDTALKAQ